MANALRHASSTRVSITLAGLAEGAVQLRVEDDGQGFEDMNQARQPAAGKTLNPKVCQQYCQPQRKSAGKIQSDPGEKISQPHHLRRHQ